MGPKGKKPVPKKTADKPAATEEKKAPTKATQKAQKVQKKIVKGTHGTRVKKVRTTVHFRRPLTFRPARNPKFPKINSSSQSYGCSQYHQASFDHRVCHEED